MRAVLADFCERFGKTAARVWRGVRDWSGDAAYEHYLKARAKRASGEAALSREQFYLEQLQKRYSRPSRCC
jgi:uncharacterized short protein YbdD (DUF466 family)